METVIIYAIVAIAIVLIFDYTNGFHDAANIIAPMIASRAMTPVQAVVIVASFEFFGPILGGTAVANTIGKFINLSDVSEVLSVSVVMCGVFGAIFWNILTWWYGIPSSSSHALVGGLAGAVIAAVGSAAVVWGFSDLFSTGKLTGVTKVILSLIVSPLLGFWVGFLVMRLLGIVLARATPAANKPLRKMQFFTAAALAFSHGANDAQKSMGIITLVLVLGKFQQEFVVPFWVVLSCAVALTLGILSGGWRIVKTVGFAIYKLRPIHAVSAQLTSAAVIFGASALGAPVSTTHVVSSAIMGIGAAERPKAVRWAKARDIASTWVITIPGSGVVGALTFYVMQFLTGVA
ncbi:MAG: inorganic phosphate transporter [Gammaproteobacteria bacterium]|jgi:PiT family inorganic phosphate transporter|nr:inorganic phosphate transporter [Candidatus Thioaporhodococcus sediminis]TNF55203.1 MAG: inorganic phosphate transporter [Gammaproteobacteria bacterium]